MKEVKWIYKHEPYFDFSGFTGIDHIINFIRTKIINPINSPLKNIGKYDLTIGNILSVGPRGTLKHELSQAIADKIHAMYFDIDLNGFSKDGVEECVERLFKEISRYEHAIVYCELPEMGNALDDVIKAQRKHNSNNGIDSVILIACCDEPWKIQSEIINEVNFKYIINHTLPNFEIRKKLLLFGEFDESDYEKDFPFTRLAEMTDKYSYESFDDMLYHIHRSDEFMKRAINQQDVEFKSKQFIKYVKKNKPKITENELTKFQEWRNEIIKNGKFKGEII